jgi:hypothetical protein
MTAHGEPTTCSARRRAAQIAASAGVRSAPWGYRYLPALSCHGWCGDHSAPAHALALSLSRHRLPFHYSLPTTHHLTRTRLARLRPARLQLGLAKQRPAGLTLRPAESSPRPIDRCLHCSCLSLCHFVSTVPVLHQVPTNQAPTASLTATTTHQHALRLTPCDLRRARTARPRRPQLTHDTAAAPYSSIANLLLPAPPPCEHVQTLRLLLPLLLGHAPCSTHPSPVRPRSCPLLLLLLAESVPLSSPTH